MERTLGKISVGLVAACVVMTVTAGGATAHRGGHSGPRDSVIANVVNNPNGNGPLADFDLVATSSSTGTDVIGGFRARQKSDGAQFIAVLTCMKVSGNRASFVGRVVWSTLPNSADYYYVRVEDNGHGNPSGDKVQFGPHAANPTSCPDPTAVDRQPITSGFVTVFDR